ncbi:hypothetical protein [Actinoallomurus acanthiterrae]
MFRDHTIPVSTTYFADNVVCEAPAGWIVGVTQAVRVRRAPPGPAPAGER